MKTINSFYHYQKSNDSTIHIDNINVDMFVKATKTYNENCEILNQLADIQCNENMPVNQQEAFAKFHSSQISYFNYLYPSKYQKGTTLLGWKETYCLHGNTATTNVIICIPARFEKDIIGEWRTYDTKKYYKMEIVDKVVYNEKTVIYAVPANDVTYCLDDDRKESFGTLLKQCPYIKKQVIAVDSNSQLWEVSELPASTERMI